MAKKKNLSYFKNLFFFISLFLLSPTSVFSATLKDWGSCVTAEDVPTLKCFEVIVSNLLTISSALIVLALFIMFVVGSLRYLTSGGNAENVKKAQATLMYAVIGTVIFVSAYLILNIIDILFLGGQEKLFEFTIPEF